MPVSSGSLDLVLDEAHAEREAQLRHFDSLDQKGGIVLGFLAVLVAVAPTEGVIVGIGRTVAAVGALLALGSFLPRKYPVLSLRALRNKYRNSEPVFTKRRRLDSTISMVEEGSHTLQFKATLLKLSMFCLALAVVLVAVGVL